MQSALSLVSGPGAPPSTDAPAAIRVEDVTLVRRTQEEMHYDLKRSVLRILSGRSGRVRRRTVLTGVSLGIAQGEKVGIIGPNGSGKSTLLKLIAGILQPTRGRVAVTGTIAPLIELGVGFDLELSVVENIVYYGVLLGHPEQLVRAHIDEILDFADLTPHREEPTKVLSSGMAARLSFAIATEFRPEVLLVDEVLSVGDERFRRKCSARIERFWDEHSTIVLVSHDLPTVARMCDRVVWLDEGIVRFDGSAQRASELYLETIPTALSFKRGEELVQAADAHERGELLVRGTSNAEQLYVIRGGRRHAISSPAWCARHGYEGTDVALVDEEVLMHLPDGEVFA